MKTNAEEAASMAFSLEGRVTLRDACTYAAGWAARGGDGTVALFLYEHAAAHARYLVLYPNDDVHDAWCSQAYTLRGRALLRLGDISDAFDAAESLAGQVRQGGPVVEA